MKYLLNHLDELKEKINNKDILFCFDYDGTLAPIVKMPEEAVLPSETKSLLKKLIKSPRCRVAIISGRKLKDIKKRVNINRVIYAGNHGFEIEGEKIKFKKPFSLIYKKILNYIRNHLNSKLCTIKKAFIEDKGLSLSLHYRLVKKRDKIKKIKTILNETATLYKKWFKIRNGKRVFEIIPNIAWNKGKAVLWLLNKLKVNYKYKNILPIYLGDDSTDENAFFVLKNKGITIFVGKPKKSKAQYYLKNNQEVIIFLRQIINLIGNPSEICQS